MQDIITCWEPSDKYGVGSINATTLCCDAAGFACGCTDNEVKKPFEPKLVHA